MEHQEVDLSTIYQPKLQLTTVTSETCASNTTGVKILCVFLQLTCMFLHLIVLETILHPNNYDLYIS